jgi:hypothetical protein
MFIKKAVWKISHRSAGLWALLSIWLCALFTITYTQQLNWTVSELSYTIFTGDSVGADKTAGGAARLLVVFLDEVALTAGNATVLVLLALMLAVFRPKHRFRLMAATLAGTAMIACGLLEKIVYAKWAGGDSMFLIAETAKRSDKLAAIDPGSFALNPAVLLDLGPMMLGQLAVSATAAALAAFNLLALARRRRTIDGAPIEREAAL